MGDARVGNEGVPYTRPVHRIVPLNDMKSEHNRLISFNSWPASAPVPAKKLARAGFYYTGHDLSVQCFHCGGIIGDWNIGDQAIRKHTDQYPDCGFVKNRPTGNIPLVNGVGNREATNTTAASRTRFPFWPTQTSCNVQDNYPDNNISSNITTPELHRGMSRCPDDKRWKSVESLRSEAERIRTFKGWPLNFIKIEELARAGFFFLKDGDKVQCVFCRGIIGEWEQGDTPITEHHRHFPFCPFVKNLEVGNEPIRKGSEPSSPRPQCRDVTGRYASEMASYRNGETERSRTTCRRTSSTPNPLVEFGIMHHAGPKHPNYATVEARIRSFRNFPCSIPQKPESLVEAGFYYAAISDHVKCFYCDGGLRNWEATDDPWVEHARWFGNCSFLILMKGQDFVSDCIRRNPAILPDVETQTPRNDSLPQYNRNPTSEDVNELMKHPVVQAVLEIGISREQVMQTIVQRMQTTGLPFLTADSLYEAVNSGTQAEVQMETSIPSNMPTFQNEMAHEICARGPPSMQSTGSVAYGSQELAAKTNELSIEEENRKLQDRHLCKICMDEEVGVVFLPCGHLITCTKCAPALKDCPMCRKMIRGTVRTFLA